MVRKTMQKISCLMVTFGRYDSNRFELFRRSFESYCEQTYDDKELIIVTCGSKEYVEQIHRHIAQSGRRDIHISAAAADTQLGGLRKIAVERAEGNIICQWDDDDINHPTRVSSQLDAMLQKKAKASFLVDYLHLFSDTKTIFWCDWTKLRLPREPGLPGTLLAYKGVLPAYNAKLSLNEDSALLYDLAKRGVSTTVIGGLGLLYVYRFHSQNVFSRAHHERTAMATARDRSELLSSASSLCYAFHEHRLTPPLQVIDNCGRSAFEWLGGVDPPLRVDE